MLKHMPTKALETFDETLLYSKKIVKLRDNVDRRPNNDNSVNKRSDDNINDQIDDFSDLINKKKDL